jgi:hypothetical protein
MGKSSKAYGKGISLFPETGFCDRRKNIHDKG